MSKTLVLLLSAAALLAAPPALARKHKTQADMFAPTHPVVPAPESVPANGAIFQAAYGYAPLTSGARAAMVGDIITIQLVESTQASKSTASNSSHDSNVGITPPTTGLLSKLFSSSDTTASSTQGFKGTGAASQSNSLSGQITVTVAQVYPNGTMLVKGEKALTLNRGDEYIQISGLVRQADIAPDNTVLSTRVADAKITYTGKGDIARASRQGWLARFFSVINPF